MALNDLHFASARRTPWLAALALALAVFAVAFGRGSWDSIQLAILLASIALALWWTEPAEVDGSVTDSGLDLIRPGMIVPFEAIGRIEAEHAPYGPRSSSFPIRVHHERGVLTIPPSPDINSEGIFRAIEERFVPSGSREVNPVLMPYLLRYETTFGPDRVWSYRATRLRADVHRPRRGRAVILAFVATGIAWFVLNVGARGPTPWPGAGLFLAFIGGLILFLRWGLGRSGQLRRIKDWRASSLVITPVGLAMVQGDLTGELTWDQIRDVKLRSRARRFQVIGDSTTGLQGIILVVDAALILIADLYDRPIDSIHERILSYWKPERMHQPIDL
jgi:hypothetical protein